MAEYSNSIEALRCMFDGTKRFYDVLLSTYATQINEHKGDIDYLKNIKLELDMMTRTKRNFESSSLEVGRQLEYLSNQLNSMLTKEDILEVKHGIDLIENGSLKTTFDNEDRRIKRENERALENLKVSLKNVAFEDAFAMETVESRDFEGKIHTNNAPTSFSDNLKVITPDVIISDVKEGIGANEVTHSDGSLGAYKIALEEDPNRGYNKAQQFSNDKAEAAGEYIKVLNSIVLNEGNRLSNARSSAEVKKNSAEFQVFKKDMDVLTTKIRVAEKTYKTLAGYQMRIDCCHKVGTILQFSGLYKQTYETIQGLIRLYYSRVTSTVNDSKKDLETFNKLDEVLSPKFIVTDKEYMKELLKEARLRLAKQGYFEKDYNKLVRGKSLIEKSYVQVLQEKLEEFENEKRKISTSLGINSIGELERETELDKEINRAYGIDENMKVKLKKKYNDACEKIDDIKAELAKFGIYSDLLILNDAFNAVKSM